MSEKGEKIDSDQFMAIIGLLKEMSELMVYNISWNSDTILDGKELVRCIAGNTLDAEDVLPVEKPLQSFLQQPETSEKS